MSICSAVKSVLRGTLKVGIVVAREVESGVRAVGRCVQETYAEALEELEQERRAAASKGRRSRRKRHAAAAAAGRAD